MGISVEQATSIMRATTLDIFNTSSQSERRKLMEKYWNSDILLYAPDGSEAKGFDAIDQVWDGLHAENRKDWKFERVGDLWLNTNAVQQAWVFGKGQENEWNGWDVIIVGKDGKVDVLYALIEGLNSHSV